MLQKAEDGGNFQHTQPIRAGLGAQEKTKEVEYIILIYLNLSAIHNLGL